MDESARLEIAAALRELQQLRQIKRLRELPITDMSDDQRLEYFALVMHGYCKHCGRTDPQGACTCWNDE